MQIAGQSVRKMAKGATRSWTMWFALALALFGAIQVNMAHFDGLIPPKAFGWLNIVTGIAVAVLRVLTTMPLEAKAPDEPQA